MATKKLNFTFWDGCEYEVTVYGSGGVKIRDEIGLVVFENGQLHTLDVLAILETLKDELKAIDGAHDNMICKIEEDE